MFKTHTSPETKYFPMPFSFSLALSSSLRFLFEEALKFNTAIIFSLFVFFWGGGWIIKNCVSDNSSGANLPPWVTAQQLQTWRILSEKTSSLSTINLSIKYWTKLWRFLKVCFFLALHVSHLAYQAATSDQERSMWICIFHSESMQQYPGYGTLAFFLHPHTLEFLFQNRKNFLC